MLKLEYKSFFNSSCKLILCSYIIQCIQNYFYIAFNTFSNFTENCSKAMEYAKRKYKMNYKINIISSTIFHIFLYHIIQVFYNKFFFHCIISYKLFESHKISAPIFCWIWINLSFFYYYVLFFVFILIFNILNNIFHHHFFWYFMEPLWSWC